MTTKPIDVLEGESSEPFSLFEQNDGDDSIDFEGIEYVGGNGTSSPHCLPVVSSKKSHLQRENKTKGTFLADAGLSAQTSASSANRLDEEEIPSNSGDANRTGNTVGTKNEARRESGDMTRHSLANEIEEQKERSAATPSVSPRPVSLEYATVEALKVVLKRFSFPIGEKPFSIELADKALEMLKTILPQGLFVKPKPSFLVFSPDLRLLSYGANKVSAVTDFCETLFRKSGEMVYTQSESPARIQQSLLATLPQIMEDHPRKKQNRNNRISEAERRDLLMQIETLIEEKVIQISQVRSTDPFPAIVEILTSVLGKNFRVLKNSDGYNASSFVLKIQGFGKTESQAIKHFCIKLTYHSSSKRSASIRSFFQKQRV